MFTFLDSPKDTPKKNRQLSILLIEDHVTTCAGYIAILNGLKSPDSEFEYKFTISRSLLEAKRIIRQAYQRDTFFDIVFLDIRMPSEPEHDLFSGEDLGKPIRELCPKSRIMVLTSIIDPFRVSSILQSIDPEGFMLKGEITQYSLFECIEKLMNDEIYYSKKVTGIIRSHFISNTTLTFEDKKFIHLLSVGVPSKRIPNYMPWSIAKVSKRKQQLQELLGVPEKSTNALVLKAKELGII